MTECEITDDCFACKNCEYEDECREHEEDDNYIKACESDYDYW